MARYLLVIKVEMNTPSKKERGFTLIEIMVFLLVAAIILPAIILPFAEGTRRLNDPTIFAAMAFLAQEVMEENMAKEYDDLASWAKSEFSGFPDYFNEGTVIFVDPVDFTTVTTVDNDFKQLTLTITYEGMNDLELTTLIARSFEE